MVAIASVPFLCAILMNKALSCEGTRTLRFSMVYNNNRKRYSEHKVLCQYLC